jgi:hypothetical protein
VLRWKIAKLAATRHGMLQLPLRKRIEIEVILTNAPFALKAFLRLVARLRADKSA